MSRRLVFVLSIVGGLIAVILVTTIIERTCHPRSTCSYLSEIFKMSKKDISRPTSESQATYSLSQLEFAPAPFTDSHDSNEPFMPVIQSDVTDNELDTQVDDRAFKRSRPLSAPRAPRISLSKLPRKQVRTLASNSNLPPPTRQHPDHQHAPPAAVPRRLPPPDPPGRKRCW